MPQPALLRLVDPSTLENVWKVDDFASEEKVLPSGFEALDAQLPGGGWPLGSMVEVLQQDAGRHAWQLVLPALSNALRQSAGPVVLVGSPFEPFGPSLQSQGLPATRLMLVHADKPASRLWATEQALKCAEVSAVMAWLPQAKNAELRRLQMASHQQGRLFFVFRDLKAMGESSPARLRLLVEGNTSLEVKILKRRGPPLEASIVLPAVHRKLTALISSRKKSQASKVPMSLPLLAVPSTQGRSHVLDRAPAHT